MSGRPKVFLTQGIPEDGEGMKLLRENCDITVYDETKTGAMAISREEFLCAIKGMDAILLPLPAKVDAESLDAAGFCLSACLSSVCLSVCLPILHTF